MGIQSTARSRRRAAFTLTDVAVGLCMIVLLAGLALPALRRANEQQRRVACAANLRALAQGCLMYANDDLRWSAFPRTQYDPNAAPTEYTGVNSAEPLATTGEPSAGRPAANDVTAAAFLLMKRGHAKPADYVCPGSDAVPWDFDGGTPAQKSNFPSRQYLGYSYTNPYPTPAAVAAGWKFSSNISFEYPVYADMNPGGSAITAVMPASPKEALAKANSPNHGGEGQNVAYADAHVEFVPTPFAGASPPYEGARLPAGTPAYRDNIYAYGAVTAAAPAGVGVRGASQTELDFVMLPTIADGPQPPPRANAIASAPAAGRKASAWGMGSVLMVVGLVTPLIGGIAALYLFVLRKGSATPIASAPPAPLGPSGSRQPGQAPRGLPGGRPPAT